MNPRCLLQHLTKTTPTQPPVERVPHPPPPRIPSPRERVSSLADSRLIKQRIPTKPSLKPLCLPPFKLLQHWEGQGQGSFVFLEGHQVLVEQEAFAAAFFSTSKASKLPNFLYCFLSSNFEKLNESMNE